MNKDRRFESYRKFKKNKCQICNSKIHLLVHHIDGNRKNNNPNNLKTLCDSCHKITHHIVRNFKEAYKTEKRNKYGIFGINVEKKFIICLTCRKKIKTVWFGRQKYCKNCSKERRLCKIKQYIRRKKND